MFSVQVCSATFCPVMNGIHSGVVDYSVGDYRRDGKLQLFRHICKFSTEGIMAEALWVLMIKFCLELLQ